MVYYPFTVLAHTKTTIHPGVGGWWMIFTLPLSTPATSTRWTVVRFIIQIIDLLHRK